MHIGVEVVGMYKGILRLKRERCYEKEREKNVGERAHVFSFLEINVGTYFDVEHNMCHYFVKLFLCYQHGSAVLYWLLGCLSVSAKRKG